MARLESEIRHAFEQRLAAFPAPPDLRARLSATVAMRPSGPRAWQVAVASAGLLLVGAVTFYLVLARHSQVAPVIGPTPSSATWVEVKPPMAPDARGDAATAYDAARRQVVLFGGDTLVSDTWTWDGRSWTKQQPASSPPARSKAAMAYDATRQEVVLFGGSTPGTLVGDTWTWNGSTWMKRHPATSPTARDGAAMAYDSLHHAIVLFGGHAAAPGSRGTGGPLDETWIWDGSNWAQAHPAISPPFREMASMAYDSGANKVVLFGGLGTSGELNDTWIWDGSDWALQGPPQSPPARYLAGMARDDGTGKIVLFGGLGAGVLNDMWTWDGSRWAQQLGATSPSARIAPALAYDAANRTLVLFGGLIIGGGGRVTDFGDTWLWAGQ